MQLNKEQAAINDLERQYKQALKDIEDRIKLLQADELTQSRIYQLRYQKALRGQVEGILDKLHGDEYATIQQYLHDSYQDGFIGTMYSVHGQGIPLILPLDQNAAVKAVITDSQIKEGLYKGIGVNIQQLKQAIRQEITRGLAANMPLADIARNIANRSKAPLSRAKTIVRTEGHRIQQASANDAREAAKANGCDVVKQWDGTLDSDTRPTHRRLDGQIRETNEPFEMDGKTAMYPGDFGKAEEDCNCRCVALTRAKWALDEDELKVLKERAKAFGLTEEEKKGDFKAFEEKYLNASEVLKKSGKSGTIVPGGVLDKFDRKAQLTHWTEDLKATNPNFAKGDEYQNNCQRCVAAYELRRRGYRVQAKPAIVNADGKLSDKDAAAAKWYSDLFDNIRWYSARGDGRMDIELLMDNWGDGARAEVYVKWDTGYSHVFVAEQANGKTYFIDPQTGSTDCGDYFSRVEYGETMFARIDNLSVTDAIDGFVENVR